MGNLQKDLSGSKGGGGERKKKVRHAIDFQLA